MPALYQSAVRMSSERGQNHGWARTYEQDKMAVSVDRLIHHAQIFMLGGESYCLKTQNPNQSLSVGGGSFLLAITGSVFLAIDRWIMSVHRLNSPQSNGKLEHRHQRIKCACMRPKTPLCLEEVQRIVAQYVRHDNPERLNSAIDVLTPADTLQGRKPSILAERAGANRIKPANCAQRRQQQRPAA